MRKKIFRAIGILIAAVLAAAVILVAVLVITEYKPQDVEAISASQTGMETAVLHGTEETLSIVSWNLGYCGLGRSADFFMDGGKSVRAQSKTQVEENLTAIKAFLGEADADVIFLQEVDEKSTRSYGIDQTKEIANTFPEMESYFAYNFKTLFVPYPLPPIGQVNSGIQTLSAYDATSTERIQLPIPFSGLVKTVNLKRCLLVSRIDLEDSDAQLVLINLHLEAFDDGEGKTQQTQMLVNLMQQEYEKGNYVIAGGDFNQSFSNIDTSMYPVVDADYWQPGLLDAQAFSDHFQLLMDPGAPSGRSLDRPYDGSSDFQYYLIDGFIVSDNMEVLSMETMDLGFEHADHNPIQMQVRLK